METRKQKGENPLSKLESLLIQLDAGKKGEKFDLKAFLEKSERENQYMNKEEAFMRFLHELSK